MIRRASLRERVTVYARTEDESSGAETTRYGDPVLVEGDGVVTEAAVQPLQATEDEVGRDTRIQRYRVIVAPDAPVDGISRLTWRGRTFEVLGEPLAFSGLRDEEVHHLEFDVREVLG